MVKFGFCFQLLKYDGKTSNADARTELTECDINRIIRMNEMRVEM